MQNSNEHTETNRLAKTHTGSLDDGAIFAEIKIKVAPPKRIRHLLCPYIIQTILSALKEN